MSTLGAKIPFLCGLIFILIIFTHTSCATRSKFQSMEHEKYPKGASMMLRDSGKAAFSLLAKGNVPPSGPSHRGHDAPRFEGHFNNKSP